jgi:hypothetical protein
MKRAAEILLLCAAVVLLMGADDSNARFHRLGSKIMCTCGDCTYMLLECNHVGCPNSTRMISELRALTGVTAATPAADGSEIQLQNDDRAVLDWFRKTWGVTAVVEPATHGLELWAWILPPAALALGLLLAIIMIRNWRSRHAAAAKVELDPRLEALRARARRETEI